MTTLRISAKNLGQLSLFGFCPRCFWFQCKMGFRTPWSIFPGVFSSFDAFQKRVVHGFFEKHGNLPPWLGALANLGTPVPVPHHSKFRYHDKGMDILLTGMPDEMLRLPNGWLHILDYKTARYTEGQDRLLPIYRTQLNGYALIAERLGMGKVAGLALVYFEPQTDVENENAGEAVKKKGFDLGFRATAVPIDLDLETIPPLLRKARELFDLPEAPGGKDGCKDCELLARLLQVAGRRTVTT